MTIVLFFLEAFSSKQLLIYKQLYSFLAHKKSKEKFYFQK